MLDRILSHDYPRSRLLAVLLLVVFVGLFDPLKAMSDTVRASFEWKGAYWEPYIFVGSIFFILCFGMSRYSMYLERRLKRDHR